MDKTCTIEGCERPFLAKGLCASHYNSQRMAAKRAAEHATERTCAHCGETYSGKDRRAKYCSTRCKQDASNATDREVTLERRQAGRQTCAQCGAALTEKRYGARFCSDRCGQDHRNARIRQERVANKPPCDNCGQPIPLNRQRFCSDECKRLARRAETYGLTRDELDALLAQHGVCAICETGGWGPKGPQVDHDHADGRVRGVLCLNCNNGLGRFQDDPKLLRAAADYIEGVA